MQSRLHSFIEACTNITVGYIINIAINHIVFKSLGIPVSLQENLLIGAIFTGVSLTRTYCIRRCFNRGSI